MVVIEDYVDDNNDDDKDETPISSVPDEEKKKADSNDIIIVESKHELTALQQEGLDRLCDACGLGPRLQPQNQQQRLPLKRCSVCHQAWYHDRTCQKDHFPIHKKVCQKLVLKQKKQQQQQQQANDNDTATTSSTTAEDTTALSSSMSSNVCRVEESTEEENTKKGRFLVANQDLPYGTVIGPRNTGTRNTGTGNTGTGNTKDESSSLQSKKKKADDDDDPNNNNHNHWKPIVAPVLLDNHRLHRCVVCFGMIDNNIHASDAKQQQLPSPDQYYYPTRLCSDACRRASACFLPSETQAIAHIYQNNPPSTRPPMILPTAVLLYRLMHAMDRDTSGKIKATLAQLQSERPNATTNDDDDDANATANANANSSSPGERQQQEVAHQEAVCSTAWIMMRASSMPLWHLDDVHALLQQVKLNGFSVCTAESVALGIGIYTSAAASSTSTVLPPVAPNLINHHCLPNLLQTFEYGVVGQFSSLRLTVCAVHGIAAEEELTLSYIDNTMPRRLRRERLSQDYGFVCRCSACGQDGDNQYDDLHVTGYKCPQHKTCPNGILRFSNHHQPPQCHICQTTLSTQESSSSPIMQVVLDQLQRDIQSIEIDEANVAALDKAYQSAKQKCIPSSWYVQEAGERLLQALLDALGSVSSNPALLQTNNPQAAAQKQYALAAQAFQLTEELLPPHVSSSSSSKSVAQKKEQLLTATGDSSRILREVLLLYKSIKLRLFLNIHPQQAMQELEQIVLPTCATFFPSQHEICKQIVQDMCL